MPDVLAPMMATLSGLPQSALKEWAFEYKWDGVRTLAFLSDGRIRLQTRNLLDVTARYPELHDLPGAVGRHSAILDGEIVALDTNDRPSFSRLQRRMHVNGPLAISKAMRDVPVFYVLFDLLHLDGRDLTALPYRERRRELEMLTLAGANWQLTTSTIENGQGMLDNAKRLALEGIVAKRLDSPYEPGRRSPNWIKVKLTRRQEFVIGGWQPQLGNPTHIGALLVGYYAPPAKGLRVQPLRYAGRVGSGFSTSTHRDLLHAMKSLESETSPFADVTPSDGPPVRFIKPKLVAEVEFRGWTDAVILRQPSFKGLREDKLACEVVRED